MWFLMLGVLGVLLKYFEVGFVATLSWWIVLIPFGLPGLWVMLRAVWTRRQLAEMDDRMLRDIGISPSEIESLVRCSNDRRRRYDTSWLWR